MAKTVMGESDDKGRRRQLKKQRQREKRAQKYNPELTVVAVAEITLKAAIKTLSMRVIIIALTT